MVANLSERLYVTAFNRFCAHIDFQTQVPPQPPPIHSRGRVISHRIRVSLFFYENYFHDIFFRRKRGVRGAIREVDKRHAGAGAAARFFVASSALMNHPIRAPPFSRTIPSPDKGDHNKPQLRLLFFFPFTTTT